VPLKFLLLFMVFVGEEDERVEIGCGEENASKEVER
jgi:hypothetical protein